MTDLCTSAGSGFHRIAAFFSIFFLSGAQLLVADDMKTGWTSLFLGLPSPVPFVLQRVAFFAFAAS